MKNKKAEKSNLENKKTLFFEIGLTLALASALVAFEWASPENTTMTENYTGDDIETIETIIPITRPEKKVPIKPPKLPEIVIVENTAEIDDVEIDWDTEVDPDESIIISQYEPEEPVDTDPVIIADKMPRYRNGELRKFQEHMQQIVEYPQRAINLDLEGKVFVQFVVNEKGEVVDIEIQRGIDPILDNAVIAALKQSETWEPGEQTGRKVKVLMSMPIHFKLSR